MAFSTSCKVKHPRCLLSSCSKVACISAAGGTGMAVNLAYSSETTSGRQGAKMRGSAFMGILLLTSFEPSAASKASSSSVNKSSSSMSSAKKSSSFSTDPMSSSASSRESICIGCGGTELARFVAGSDSPRRVRDGVATGDCLRFDDALGGMDRLLRPLPLLGFPRASGGRAGFRFKRDGELQSLSSWSRRWLRVWATHEAVGCRSLAEGGKGGFLRLRASVSIRCRSATSACSCLSLSRR
mmetsp:Transcript_12231/g.24771  ORF Transcript_12231/g.24771 Transcript_12231/m.24771 type:complete len:241 (+) Transcript_12231:143-865(+)